MIDDLDREIAAIDRELQHLGAEHDYVPLLMSVPGIAWVLGYTIASEIGDIQRFASPKKLSATPACAPASTSPATPTAAARSRKPGPKYLRWALIEAAQHACRHPPTATATSATRPGSGKQRGAKVAQVDIARRLAEAIWHMLTRNQPFAPAGATPALAA